MYKYLIVLLLSSSFEIIAQTNFHEVNIGWITKPYSMEIEQYNLSIYTQVIAKCIIEKSNQVFGNPIIDSVSSSYQVFFNYNNVENTFIKNRKINVKMVISKMKHPNPKANFDSIIFYIKDESGNDLLIPSSKTQKRIKKELKLWIKNCLN